MIELRPYQAKAKDAIIRQWDQGRKHTLLVLPTGTGKTVVFSAVTEDEVRHGRRVLILAHRGELLEQAADKLHKATGLRCAVEKAEESCLGSWYMVTVGSVQSLCRPARLDQFAPDYFKTIIIDEAHHALSISYQNILEHFPEARVLGVTATPERGDHRNLGSFFESLAFEYTLPEAIKEGYLCKIKAQTIPLQLDISNVGISSGDFAVSQVGSALDPYLDRIADELLIRCRQRKTVVFLPLIATSRKFCRMLNDRGISAVEVNGTSEDRAQILKDFNDGRYQVLCNSMLLTEGWDCPSVDCIVILRPTKVRSLFCQMVGRGTRICEGKEDLLLLDFLWMTDRHDLCRPACLICKDEAVARKMTQNMEDGEAISMEEAEVIAETDVIAEREEALAKQLAMMRKKRAKLVDPLQYAISIQSQDIVDYTPIYPSELEKPSERQIERLEKLGIFGGDINSAGMADQIIHTLTDRIDAGLTTPKQIRFLEQKGFRHVGTWSFDQANKMIKRIAVNNWRTPFDIDPATFIPA